MPREFFQPARYRPLRFGVFRERRGPGRRGPVERLPNSVERRECRLQGRAL